MMLVDTIRMEIEYEWLRINISLASYYLEVLVLATTPVPQCDLQFCTVLDRS